MKRFGALALVAVLFVVANACSSDEADAIRRGKLADGCLINSDCSQSPLPLVCAFERCHIKCEKDADCEPGLYCRIADNPVHVCQLPSEVPDPPCKYSSECPGSQVCGIDGVCRDGCRMFSLSACAVSLATRCVIAGLLKRQPNPRRNVGSFADSPASTDVL